MARDCTSKVANARWFEMTTTRNSISKQITEPSFEFDHLFMFIFHDRDMSCFQFEFKL